MDFRKLKALRDRISQDNVFGAADALELIDMILDVGLPDEDPADEESSPAKTT